MKRLIALLAPFDDQLKFMILFQLGALILLTVLYRFMKERHKKLWLFLCVLPLIVFLIFYGFNYTHGEPAVAFQRYAGLGAISIITLLWGVAIYFRGSPKVYSLFAYPAAIGCFGMTVVSVLLYSMIYDLGNFTACDWETSFSKTIDHLEKSYVNRYWKEIDFDSIRSELIPKVRQAQQNGDKAAFGEALYELKYDLFDGHVNVEIKDFDTSYEVSRRLAGNDYGLSMFRDSAGEVLAVLVDEDSEAAANGIKNGTVITKWDGQPIDEAVSQVRCIDTFFTYSYIENEDIFRPIFLAGKGGDSVEVTFISDDGKERTAVLSEKGSYLSRLHNAIDIVNRGGVIEHNDNYFSCMLNDNCGYFRVTSEYYYYEGMDYVKAELFDEYEEMRQEISGKMNDLKAQGMDRLVIDLRNNSGGMGMVAQNIASVFVDVNFLSEKAFLTRNGKMVSLAKPAKIGKAEFSDIPITVIVNSRTCSAGDCLTYWLSRGDNTQIVGSTYPWGCAQGIGGTCLLTDCEYEFTYPVNLTLSEEGVPIADAKSDRKARVTLDHKLEYDRDGVVELFSDDNTKDEVLEYAVNILNETVNAR